MRVSYFPKILFLLLPSLLYGNDMEELFSKFSIEDNTLALLETPSEPFLLSQELGLSRLEPVGLQLQISPFGGPGYYCAPPGPAFTGPGFGLGYYYGYPGCYNYGYGFGPGFYYGPGYYNGYHRGYRRGYDHNHRSDHNHNHEGGRGHSGRSHGGGHRR